MSTVDKEQEGYYLPQHKNMAFFLDIIKRLNLNYTDVARAAGITPQLVAYWINHDDIKFSKLIEVLKALKIRVECVYSDTDDEEEYYNKYPWMHDRNHWFYELDMTSLKNYKNELSGKGSVIDNAISSNARLKFLALLIKEMNLSLVEFCEKIKRNYQSMHHCFKVDDIKMSIVYDIARKTGRKLIWNLAPDSPGELMMHDDDLD